VTPAEYHRRTRDLTTAFFFVAPLLAFYEIGIVSLGADVRNGADVLLRSLFGTVGDTGVLLFNATLLVLSVIAGVVVVRRDRPVLVLIAPVVAEAAVYAVFFAPVVLLVESRVLPYLAVEQAPPGGGLLGKLVLAAGAGVYEELLFRMILAGSLFYLCDRVARIRRVPSFVASILLSALLFAGFHHVGVYGERFAVDVFLFRTLAGILLSAIFLTRGLAVAVYTHAFYDVLVFVQHGG